MKATAVAKQLSYTGQLTGFLVPNLTKRLTSSAVHLLARRLIICE